MREGEGERRRGRVGKGRMIDTKKEQRKRTTEKNRIRDTRGVESATPTVRL